MRYVTHQFAHLETLSIARRWLVQLGFDPGQIETHTEGTPRLAIAIRPEQRALAEMVINAAELSDPNAWPSFWDVAQQPHVFPSETVATPEFTLPHTHTDPIGWHPEKSDHGDSADMTKVWDVMTRFE